MAGYDSTVFLSSAAMADRERLHSAGDGDVEEPALFIERGLGLGTRVRQQAVFHANDVDVGKLQPFATVHRDEGHGVAWRLVLLVLALVIQANLFEESLETVEGRLRGRFGIIQGGDEV